MEFDIIIGNYNFSQDCRNWEELNGIVEQDDWRTHYSKDFLKKWEKPRSMLK